MLECPFVLCNLRKSNVVVDLGFCSSTIQLGLQLQVGHDMSSVRSNMKSVGDDVSAVKDGVKAVEEGMKLYRQASQPVSYKKPRCIRRRRLVNL